MVYEIYFFGLIGHVGENDETKQFAVIVKATDHVPMIVVNKKSHPLYKDENVSFSIGSGDAQTTSSFKKFVPPLSKLISGTNDLKPQVKTRASENDVIGYVHYPPAGSLGVADLFDDGALYTLGQVEKLRQCAASLTYLSVSTNASLEVRHGNASHIVAEAPWILIMNSSSGSSLNHFRENLKMTQGSDIATVTKIDLNCETLDEPQYLDDVVKYLKDNNAKGFRAARANGDVAMTEATDVECSNSRWP